jgi:hypothetical protein
MNKLAEVLWGMAIILGLVYFIFYVLPDMHKAYIGFFVKEECLK